MFSSGKNPLNVGYGAVVDYFFQIIVKTWKLRKYMFKVPIFSISHVAQCMNEH